MTTVTTNTTLKDLEQIPELQEISGYLLYRGMEDERPKQEGEEQFWGMPISSVGNIGWSPEGMVRGMNFLIEQFAAGAKPYFIYPKEEWADDPQKKHVNVVRLVPEQIDPQKPFIILVSGGGYQLVCSATESYPTAVSMVARGYQVFVLTYRVGGKGVLPKALDDLAAAISFIRGHGKEFQLNPDFYAIGGFSAGANLISSWGLSNIGYGAYGLPKPKAMFPVYTVINLAARKGEEGQSEFLETMLGEGYTLELQEKYDIARQITADYPPCYIVCGKDDTVVPCANSELLKERLDQLGIPALLNEGEHAPHGFGDGTGTDVEGWPEAAIDFLEEIV